MPPELGLGFGAQGLDNDWGDSSGCWAFKLRIRGSGLGLRVQALAFRVPVGFWARS